MCDYPMLSHIKFQTKYRYSLQESNRMIVAFVIEPRLLIDIFSPNKHSLKKVGEWVA
jgi:hypothetical protein